jgi:broad specificity phosphatase PhoE
MGPTIHCVRHAQGYHNLSVQNHSMHDPQLTPTGEQQCRDLAKNFPYHDSVEAVVASPIKRTVYTALLAFGEDLEKKDLKVIALPELQETSDLPCDTGSDPDQLAKEFDGKPVDLSLVKPGWNSKRMKWAPSAKAIEARAREARIWLSQRPEKEIVVVTHGMALALSTPLAHFVLTDVM